MKATQIKTFDEVIRFAVGKEEEAARTYAGLARSAKGADVKKMFEELSKQEEGHKAKLLKIEVSGLPSKPVSKVPDLKISEYLAEAAVGPGASYQDILIFAMKREEASTGLYSELAKAATNESVCSLFLLLAEEEKKHKLRLEKEYDDNVLKEN
jgi:rubrerythrin